MDDFVEVVELIVELEIVSVEELVAVVVVELLIVSVVIIGVVVASNDVSKKDFYQYLTQAADRTKLELQEGFKFKFKNSAFLGLTLV